MSGSSWRNANVFESLCGDGALQNVMLVTTMWDSVDEKAGSAREEELQTQYWDSMIAAGARTIRFDHTSQGAWNILDQLPDTRQPTKLQVQIVDEGKPLAQTDAGIRYFGWLDRLLAQFRRMIEALEQLLPGFSKGGDLTVVKGLQRRKSEAKRNFRRVSDMQKQLVTGRTAKRSTLPFAKVTPSTSPSPLARGSTSDSRTSLPDTRSNLGHVSAEDSNFYDGRPRAATRPTLAPIKTAAEMTPVPFLQGIHDLTSMIADSIEVCLIN